MKIQKFSIRVILAQCGKWRIFILPLRFYVKSILGILEVQNFDIFSMKQYVVVAVAANQPQIKTQISKIFQILFSQPNFFFTLQCSAKAYQFRKKKFFEIMQVLLKPQQKVIWCKCHSSPFCCDAAKKGFFVCYWELVQSGWEASPS